MAKKPMRPKWAKKLTMAEWRHVKEDAGCTSLAALKRTFEQHDKWREEKPDTEPCWTCRGIQEKLGL